MRVLLIIISLFCLASLFGQSAAVLKEKRQRLLADLKSTTKELDATKAKRSAAMSRLNLLQRQIDQRRELITTLNQEIALNEERVARNQDVVNALNGDLDRMRTEYAETLRSSYRAKLTNGWLAFILSADGLNDGFRRVQYLRQYQSYRRRQSKLILDTQKTLLDKTVELEERRAEKEELLIVAQDQGTALEESLVTQTGLVDELTGEEKRLFSEVQKQQKEQAILDKAIEEAIAEEIAASQSAEQETTGERPNPPPLVEASGFSGNRGRLPWPVKGDITMPFGRQPHPRVPSVTINNGGIDIDGGRGARVQAVFAGKIISIREIPGYRNTIMVRHGNYYTVYSNLEKVLVKVGEEIEARATIGYTSRGGDPIHFELWKGRDRQDPSKWLN